jgi:hypothetical protein
MKKRKVLKSNKYSFGIFTTLISHLIFAVVIGLEVIFSREVQISLSSWRAD